MDMRLWTLRCKSCGVVMTLELAAGQSVIASARDVACSTCKAKPVGGPVKKPPAAADWETEVPGNWHVIGFRSTNLPPR